MMRKLLAGALMTALAIPTLAVDAHAHGGQYRGPGGALPPGLKEPSDPQPPPPPPPTGEPPVTPPPTGPKGRPTPPITDPGGSPVTPTGDPLTGGSGRPKAAKATITADSWVFWYEYNKDTLEDLKRHIYALSGSNNNPFGSTLAEAGARSGARQATRAAVHTNVVPALLWAINPKNVKHQDIESAAYIALAKMTSDPAHIELLQKGTASKNGVTAESCCLALGMLRRDRPADRFDAVTLDRARAFLFTVFEDDKQRARKRAFAAFALGLLGDQPTGSDGYDGSTQTTARLFTLLENEHGHPDLPASVFQALGMQPAASFTSAQHELLRSAASKSRIYKHDIQDYVAAYAAQALGKVGDPAADLHALQRMATGRRIGLNVQRSAAIALGTLGARATAAKRLEIARELLDGIGKKRIREQTARNLAQISLAYLVMADVRSDNTALLGDDRVRSFLLTQADDGRASVRPYGALALGLCCREIGDSTTVEVNGEFQAEARDVLRRGLRSKKLAKRGRAAFAVALGIAGDDRSIKDLVALVADEKEDAELRGYSAIALGHIGVATTQVLTPIRDALVSRRSERLRQASATALGLLQDKHAVSILLRELKTARSQSAKGQVVVALAKVGDERAIAPLVNRLKDGKEQELTRALACAGLGIVGDINWIPALSGISKNINWRASGDAFNEVLSIL